MVYSPFNQWTFPVNPNFPWVPDVRYITSITQSNPAVITTSEDHEYETGMNVRIVFPFPYILSFGMTQINNETGTITVLSPTTFSININTTNYDPFVIGTTLENAQVVPIGQYTNQSLEPFEQVNPPNPSSLTDVPVFQQPGLQAAGPCSQAQT